MTWTVRLTASANIPSAATDDKGESMTLVALRENLHLLAMGRKQKANPEGLALLEANTATDTTESSYKIFRHVQAEINA